MPTLYLKFYIEMDQTGFWGFGVNQKFNPAFKMNEIRQSMSYKAKPRQKGAFSRIVGFFTLHAKESFNNYMDKMRWVGCQKKVKA